MRYTDFAGAIIGGETNVVEVPFSPSNFPALTLKTLEVGERLLEIVVKITEEFDAGVSMSLGFPADNEEIAPASKLKLQRLGVYKFFPYRKTTATETFRAYFSGASATGAGIIYFYQ